MSSQVPLLFWLPLHVVQLPMRNLVRCRILYLLGCSSSTICFPFFLPIELASAAIGPEVLPWSLYKWFPCMALQGKTSKWRIGLPRSKPTDTLSTQNKKQNKKYFPGDPGPFGTGIAPSELVQPVLIGTVRGGSPFL